MKPTSPNIIFKRHYCRFFDHLYPYLIKLPTEKFPQNKTDKTPTFNGIPPHVTILTMLEAIRISQDGMVDEVSGNIIAELRNRGKFGSFSEESMQLLLAGMWNKIQYALKDSKKQAGQLEECSDSKITQSVLNGRNFKYHFWEGRFHMLPQSYTFITAFVSITPFKFG